MGVSKLPPVGQLAAQGHRGQASQHQSQSGLGIFTRLALVQASDAILRTDEGDMSHSILHENMPDNEDYK